jgi:hypothetical protein
MTVAFVKHSAYGDGHNSGHDDSQERPDHSQQNIEHHEHEQCGNEPLADLLRVMPLPPMLILLPESNLLSDVNLQKHALSYNSVRS